MDLLPDWQLNMDSKHSTFLVELLLPHLVSQTLDSELWINSAKLLKMSQLSPICQSLLMLIPDSVKDKCVPELSLTFSTVEQVDFILKIKFSQKDVVTWMENNSFLPIKWLIRLELQDKQALKSQMANLSFVPELTLKECTDCRNASRDQRVLSTQVLIWYSHKDLIQQNNSK